MMIAEIRNRTPAGRIGRAGLCLAMLLATARAETNDYVLVPAPREITYHPGDCRLTAGSHVWVDLAGAGDLLPVAEQLRDALGRLYGGLQLAAADGANTSVEIRVLPDRVSRKQGYELVVAPGSIRITAHDTAGAFYAAQTLKQMCRVAEGKLRCLKVSDWPDFPNRGVMLDISRDKVPTMETLYQFVDKLAEFKVNQLQLYTQHTFDFVKEIHRLVSARGRTMQMWGDIVMKHPELIGELPKDVIVLEWGYDADHPFDANCRKYAAVRVPFYVCPGTSTWRTVTGRTSNASVLFYMLVKPEENFNRGPYGQLTRECLAKTLDYLDRVMVPLEKSDMEVPDSGLIRDELSCAANLLRHACRLGIARLEAPEKKIENIPSARRAELAAELLRILDEYQRLWLLRSRPGGLADSVAVFAPLLKRYQADVRPTDLLRDWSSRLRYVGVVLEDPDYHIWGSSPIWGDDGKVHVFASRIPVATGFDKWWATSQIAHYTADRPEGPFTLVEVLLQPGQSAQGEWDTGTQHNPTITRIDDRYVLCYHSSISTVQKRVRSSERIGMMTADDINGPWKKIGRILDPPTAEKSREVPPDYNGNTDNPSLVRHPDGRFFLYYRIKHPDLEGQCTYGGAIADKLEGPYVHHPTRVVNNPTYIEDPYVFLHGGFFHMLVTDNGKNRGLLLASKDGLHFDYYQGHGFGTIADYIPAEKLPPDSSKVPRGIFERPQLLFKDGAPTHLYVPCRTNINGGKGACCYLFAIDAR